MWVGAAGEIVIVGCPGNELVDFGGAWCAINEWRVVRIAKAGLCDRYRNDNTIGVINAEICGR
jgi:hypothetical protein